MSHLSALAPSRFLATLGPAAREALLALAANARQKPPAHWIPWHCGSNLLGYISPTRADWLCQHLQSCSADPQGLQWDALGWTEPQRSECVQAAMLAAHVQGLMPAWRDERFSFWDAECSTPDPQRPALFHAERSGFRFLGIPSHAVHINGFLPDGRLWCARRSLSKATDPGMLDNLTAGGLPRGETVWDCLVRELAEEAGITDVGALQCEATGLVRTARLEPEGWHDETIHVFNLSLPFDFQPANGDGEVAEFLCLTPDEAMERIQAGEFTVDAVQSLVQGLVYVT